MISFPPMFGPTSRPFSATIAASTPKNGKVALPGFVGIAPGNGVIMIAPVSVCHQVSTIGQRSVDHIAVPSDPADIGRAPKNVLVADVEDIFHCCIDADEVTAGGVQDSLWLPGRTAGVENVKRMFAVERRGRAIGIDIFKL